MDYHASMMSRVSSAHPDAPRESAKADSGREAWALIVGFFRAAKGKHLAELELTAAQAQLLLNLEPGRPLAMNELANALGCDASNVTGLVDRLEARNLIERRSDPADRRVKMIAVTPTGEDVRARLRDRWYEPPPPIAALAERDQKQLLDILRRAAAATTDAP